MKSGGKALVLAMSGVVFTTCARAADVEAESAFRYHGITERNVFNLKDPPPPPTNAPPPVAVPKIELTLITTIFGDKRAGLKWTPPPTKPGEPPKVESPILSIGQAQGGVEVLDIDENEGTVKIRNHDQLQTLNFTSDGAKLTAQPLPVGGPPNMPQPIPAPQNPVPGAAMPNANPAMRTLPQIPQRTLRLPGAPGSAIAAPNSQAVATFSSGAVAGQPNPQPQQPEFTPEQQALIIEAQRKYYQERGDPIATILPPTSLTPRPAQPAGPNLPQSP